MHESHTMSASKVNNCLTKHPLARETLLLAPPQPDLQFGVSERLTEDVRGNQSAIQIPIHSGEMHFFLLYSSMRDILVLPNGYKCSHFHQIC